MRVTSDPWVAALLRRVFGDGGFGAVLKRGGDSAGAIFLVMRDRMGEAVLFGPAPQSGYGEGRPNDRMFVELIRTVEPDAIDARLEKEKRFDPDLWLVEIEPGKPGADLFPIMTP